MKKIILGILGIFLFLGTAVAVKVFLFPEPVILDATSNLVMDFNGVNGEGVASVKENPIVYDGNKKSVLNIINSIEYDISPSRNLSNYDDITVTVKADDEEAEKANVVLKNTQKKFQVRGLEETQEQKEELYDTVDGYEIPKSWNLSDEEKQAYIEYQKQIESGQGEMLPDYGVQDIWNKGTSKEESHKKNQKFYVSECGNNSEVAFKRATEYGEDSSQEYKVVPIIEEETMIGYECIFKE